MLAVVQVIFGVNHCFPGLVVGSVNPPAVVVNADCGNGAEGKGEFVSEGLACGKEMGSEVVSLCFHFRKPGVVKPGRGDGGLLYDELVSVFHL